MHKRRAGTHEWVHPETICLDGIAHGDVPRDALVVAQLAEDAEGLREAELEERALLELRLAGVGEDARAGEGHRRLARGRADVDVAVGVDVGGRLVAHCCCGLVNEGRRRRRVRRWWRLATSKILLAVDDVSRR